MTSSITPATLAIHLLLCAAIVAISAVIVRRMITAGLLDHPDPRKVHRSPVPKGGGVGIVAAFLAGLALLCTLPGSAALADPYWISPYWISPYWISPYWISIVLPATAIAAVAFLDDVRDWPFTIKLGTQIAAALLAVAGGLVVDAPNLPIIGPVPLGWLAPVAAFAWILFATNAMNFIDGLNGLAAGVAVIACAALAGIAATAGSWFVYAACLLLASGLIGFLPFNFPRAKIFMGDVGSQFCGFLLATIGIAAARFDRTELSALLVPMLLSGVLFDVAFTLVRRVIAGDDPTQAHRSHLYQVAHRAGISPVAITLIHWAFALWGAAACALFLRLPIQAKPLAVLAVLAPQPIWTLIVVNLAQRAKLGRW